MAEYERAKTGTTQKVDRVALLCDLRQFPRHIGHKSNAVTLIRPGREAIYSDCRPRSRVVANGWPVFFLLFRPPRAPKKSGNIFLSVCQKRELCTDIGDEKAFRMRCLAGSIADKDGSFSRLGS